MCRNTVCGTEPKPIVKQGACAESANKCEKHACDSKGAEFDAEAPLCPCRFQVKFALNLSASTQKKCNHEEASAGTIGAERF